MYTDKEERTEKRREKEIIQEILYVQFTHIVYNTLYYNKPQNKLDFIWFQFLFTPHFQFPEQINAII